MKKFLAMLCATAALCAIKAPAADQKSYDIEVPAAKEWVDTGIDVHGGAKVRFTGTGTITYPAPTDNSKFQSSTVGSFGRMDWRGDGRI